MSIQISTRIDEQTKQQFDEICERIGISPSNALSIFIKAVINNNGIPFAVMAPPISKELPPTVAEDRQVSYETVNTKTKIETNLQSESEESDFETQAQNSTSENHENFFKKWEAGRKTKVKTAQIKSNDT